MLILGIDPGANTGVAHFLDGELTHLETIAPHQIERTLREAMPSRVVFEAVRHKIGVLTPAEVELIRTSELTGAELSIQLGKTKSAVNNVRAGKTYRDYSQAAANPFAGLLGRGAHA